MFAVILSMYFSSATFFTKSIIPLHEKDSIRAVFIMNLLNDYNNKNTLIKSGIDSCGFKWIELIPSKVLYNYYVDSIHLPFPVYKRMVTELLLDTNYFDRCERNEIKGIKINNDLYKQLILLPTNKVLKLYFDETGYLKNKYKKYQYELYAYFYDRQICLHWQNQEIYINRNQE